MCLNLVLTENLAPGTFEKAILRFAHAETVIPFTCLLGLFIDDSGMFDCYIVYYFPFSLMWCYLQISSRFKRRSPWIFLQSPHGIERGGETLLHHLLETTYWLCTIAMITILSEGHQRANILSKFSTMK